MTNNIPEEREALAQEVRNIVIAHNGYLREAIGNRRASGLANEVDRAIEDFILADRQALLSRIEAEADAAQLASIPGTPTGDAYRKGFDAWRTAIQKEREGLK